MYSIPDYSLRFAAHCRSRLKYLDIGADDTARGSAVANAARFWIRFAPHTPRADHIAACDKRYKRGVTP